ncbi:MAG: membrane dipeptidase [Caldilineaceae bacterium]|nr:membrane dipeptidase [Caldilineaceae bacterium]
MVSNMSDISAERADKIWSMNIVIDGLAVNAHNWQKQTAAGLTAVNVTLASANSSFYDMLKRMDPYLMLLSIAPQEVLLVRRSTDILRAKNADMLGLIFGWQNGSPLGEDPMYVRVAHALGVRIIQLTYNERNAIGDGCLEPENRGLTAFGRQVVVEMNRLGILIDLSHVGDRTCAEVIDHSAAPCIFSHANPRVLSNSPRNKPDDLIRAIAARGGLIGLTPYAPFSEIRANQRPTAEDYFRLVDYAVNLVGIDSVAFGTDMPEGRDRLAYEIVMAKRYPDLAKGYDHTTRHASGFDSLEELRKIPYEMLKRGYTDEDIRKFLGGNLLRVFAEVWDR